MIWFFTMLAAGFFIFGCAFIIGVAYGIEQEQNARRLTYTVTCTDPGVDIPVKMYGAIYDHEDRGDFA